MAERGPAPPPAPDAAAPLRGWRLWIGIIGLLAIAAVTLMAGRWQLSRADEKADIAARIEAARQAGPLTLAPAVAESALVPWREAVASGTWQPGHTVLLDNRNHEGRPGYWVATPLCLASPDAPEPAPDEAIDCDTAVLVLRGWLSRGTPGAPPPDLPAPVAGAPVQGILLSHVPRLFDLAALRPGEPDAQAPLSWAAGTPTVQNLTVPALAAATGLPLLPVVLEQRNDTGDGLARHWAGPALETDKHTGYALQWFSFAAIALIALGVILVKAFRRRRH